MENPFKKILHHRQVPEILREKILNDIGVIKLSIDLTDLFVIKFPSTFGDLFATEKNYKNKKEN